MVTIEQMVNDLCQVIGLDNEQKRQLSRIADAAYHKGKVDGIQAAELNLYKTLNSEYDE